MNRKLCCLELTKAPTVKPSSLEKTAEAHRGKKKQNKRSRDTTGGSICAADGVWLRVCMFARRSSRIALQKRIKIN